MKPITDVLVSVIIPTWNSERTIDSCLQSIVNQTYKKIEIIVVDGGSTDNTLKIVKKYPARLIVLNKRGRTYQRNQGVLNAKGELLLQVDSDEVLHPRLIEECVKKILYTRLDALFITTIDTGFSYIGKSRCFGNIINLKLRKDIWIPNSALRFYRKIVFQNVGGYDEDILVGEDIVFALKCLNAGFKVSRCKSFILHYGTEGLKNIFLKKYYYGKTFGRYRERVREISPVESYSPLRSYIKTGVFYLLHLFYYKNLGRYILGFVVVKLIETLGLLLGYIFSI
jgi:glycosyltransferase involved in cell wall biosynthesis